MKKKRRLEDVDLSLPEPKLLELLDPIFEETSVEYLPGLASHLLVLLKDRRVSAPPALWRKQILRLRKERAPLLLTMLEDLAGNSVPGLSRGDFETTAIEDPADSWLKSVWKIRDRFRAKCLRLYALAHWPTDSNEVSEILRELESASKHMRCNNVVLLKGVVRLKEDPRLKEVPHLLAAILRDHDMSHTDLPTAPSRVLRKLASIARSEGY